MKTANTKDHKGPVPRLVIDLAAIQRNYAKLQTLAGDAEVGAVIKADAYGLGVQKIVPALSQAGCQNFYAANASEGVQIRQALAGQNANIFSFSGFWPDDLNELRQHALYPVICELSQLENLRDIAPDMPFAIQFDTGMNRLGLEADETEILTSNPDLLDGLKVKQIISHLACADERDHPMNARQLSAFSKIRSVFPKIPASFSNSAASLLGTDFHYDILRPGIALFGGNPAPENPNPFEPAIHIEAPILQIRDLKPGDMVGYGASWKADRKLRLATLALGYADGIMRSCQQGGFGRIGKTKTPIVGRISMDMLTVDISDIDHDIQLGDRVTFLGPDLDGLADKAQTISYELLVRLGPRLQRVYTD